MAGARLSTDEVVTVTLEVGGASGADFGYTSPTAVRLAGFSALAQAAAVELAWQVMLLDGGAAPAFHIWRQSVSGGEWRRLAGAVTPAAYDGQVAGYAYTDAQIKHSAAYLYRLEADDGVVFGPWPARTQAPMLYLPALSR